MRLVSTLAAALAAVVPAFAPAASLEANLIPMYDADGVNRVCDAGIVVARKAIDAMAARTEPDGLLEEWNRLFILIDDASNPPSFYATLHPDKDVRAAAEACDQKFNTLNTELNLKAYKPANAKQEKLRRDLLNNFEDSGAALPPDKRARAKEIAEISGK